MTSHARKCLSWVPLSLVFVLVILFGYSFSSTQRELRESRERYNLAVQSSNAMLVVWDTQWDFESQEAPDVNEKVWLSGSFSQFLNKPAQECVSTIGDLLAIVHEDDRGLLISSIREALRSHHKNLRYAEYRLRTSDNDWKWHSVRGSLMQSSSRGYLRVAGAVTPIEITREERIMLYGVIDISPTPIIICDESRNVIAWNTAVAELTGYPAADVLGRKVEDFLITDPSVAKKHAAHYSEVSRLASKFGNYLSESSSHPSGEIRKHDGSTIVVNIYPKMIRYGNKLAFAASLTVRSDTKAVVPEVPLSPSSLPVDLSASPLPAVPPMATTEAPAVKPHD